jgi:acylphosphatase
MEAPKVSAHVFVCGRVQGVFFRVETRRMAIKNNVVGWVRNTSDGKVEALFEGGKNDVKKLTDFCRRGPPSANVTKSAVVWGNYSGEFNDFKIRKSVVV